MEYNDKTLCFSGHRELPEDVEAIRSNLKSVLKRLAADGLQVCICGGAAGFDLLCGETVLELKSEFPKLRLVTAVPCPSQEMYYGSEDKKRYRRLIENSETVLCSSRYHRYCMILRNQYMVERSRYLVCYLRKRSGGTYETRAYAEMKGRVIIDL